MNRPEHDRILTGVAHDLGGARENQKREVARIALPEQDLIGIEMLQHGHPTQDLAG